MKINKNISLKIVFFGILAIIFWNDFLPSANSFFNLLNPDYPVYNIDFYSYYRGSRLYLSGIDPYENINNGQLFIYPPTFVPLYAQISKLDYETARYLWVWIYSACFLISVILLLSRVKPEDRDKMVFTIVLILLLSYPVKFLIRQGQIDLIVASLCFTSLILYLNHRHNLSALTLAAATLIKVSPVLLLITFFVFFRDWKYLIRYGTAVVGLVGISLLFFPFDWYRIYFTTVLPSLSVSNPSYYQQTLARFLAGSAKKTRLLSMFGYGLMSICAWIIGHRYIKQIKEIRNGNITSFNEFIAVAFFFCNSIVTLIFSASAWLMTYTWFILPAAWIIWFAYKNIQPWLLFILLIGVAMIHGQLLLFNEINMSGAIICLLCLIGALFFPDVILKNKMELQLNDLS